MKSKTDILIEKLNEELSTQEKDIMNHTMDIRILKAVDVSGSQFKKTKPINENKVFKKAVKRIRSAIKEVYNEIIPGIETVTFHFLLDSLEILATINKQDIKIADKEIKCKKLYTNYPETNDIMLIKRCQNLLTSMVETNDRVINRYNLIKIMEKLSSFVVIESYYDFELLKEEEKNLRAIATNMTVLQNMENEVIKSDKFKYDKNTMKNIRYCITAIKNKSIKLANELISLEIKLKYPKYADLIIKSIELEGCKYTNELVESYVEYLVWLDKENCLESEYELVA